VAQFRIKASKLLSTTTAFRLVAQMNRDDVPRYALLLHLLPAAIPVARHSIFVAARFDTVVYLEVFHHFGLVDSQK
jgi:predicted TPR repeat methyltransferase